MWTVRRKLNFPVSGRCEATSETNRLHQTCAQAAQDAEPDSHAEFYAFVEGARHESARTEPITKAVSEVLKAVEKLIPPHGWTLLIPGSKQHDVMDAVHNLRKLLETGER